MVGKAHAMSLKYFTKEIDYRLIDLLESKPLLWDCTSDIYRRTDLKTAAWDEIAKQLGSHITGVMVSSRFKNIKDTFSRNLRAMKESKRSGTGTDNIYKPKWHMFDRLMFLKRACVQGNSVSNISSVQSEATATSISESSQIYNVGEDDYTSKDLSILNIHYDKASQKFTYISDKADVEAESEFSSQDSLGSYSDFGVSAVSNTPPLEMYSSPQPRTQSLSAHASCNTTTQALHQERNLGAAATTKRLSEDHLFNKRGSKMKKSSTLMEEAVDVLKQFCSSDPPSSASSSQTEKISDTAHTLALFVETRLRSLPLESRKNCENDILEVLTKY